MIPGLATSMCGWTSGLTLLYLAEGNKNLEFKHIDYCNSGDSPYGDKDEVVGYNAIAVIEKNQKDWKNQQESVTDFRSQRKRKISFSKLQKAVSDQCFMRIKELHLDEKNMPENLKKQLGAFVTLKD